jgi:hypothetical protein
LPGAARGIGAGIANATQLSEEIQSEIPSWIASSRPLFAMTAVAKRKYQTARPTALTVIPMMPAMTMERVVDPAGTVTDRRSPERLAENGADHASGDRTDGPGDDKS